MLEGQEIERIFNNGYGIGFHNGVLATLGVILVFLLILKLLKSI